MQTQADLKRREGTELFIALLLKTEIRKLGNLKNIKPQI
jgi:hypothetical protein